MRWAIVLCGGLSLAIPANARAQTVQLPSFSTFSVDTSVLVPDRGAAPLAGSRAQRTSANRVGGAAADPAARVARRAAAGRALAPVDDPTNQLSHAARDPAPLSPAEIDNLRAARAAQRQGEAYAWLEKARHARNAGKPAVARLYYRNAGKQADDIELRQRIDAELKALPGR
jgi:hypothetical protein